jgi:hypothetical protein
MMVDNRTDDHQAQRMAVAVKQEGQSKLLADASTDGMTHNFRLMSHTTSTNDHLVEC